MLEKKQRLLQRMESMTRYDSSGDLRREGKNTAKAGRKQGIFLLPRAPNYSVGGKSYIQLKEPPKNAVCK